MKNSASAQTPPYSDEPDRLGSGAVVVAIVLLVWLVTFAAIWWVA